jgi:signal transduction histidine kinase
VRLSYKIPIFTGIAVIATVFVNIFAFQFFIQELLPGYQQKIEDAQWLPGNTEQLQTLTTIGKLDKNLQNEYQQVLIELSNLQASLQNISSNPELYTQSGTRNTETFSIPLPTNSGTTIIKARDIIDTIANPQNFSKDSPEWVFIIDLINRILITNLLWLACIISWYAFWINRVFIPIDVIIRKLQKYIDTSEYTNIPYNRNDEFFPLISTINNLHKSLSLQENIRSNFLSDLSHEIRTPITAVKCYLEAIEDGMMKINETTAPLLQKELTRLADITERIMEYEHLAHDGLNEIHIEQFDPEDTISELIEEYTPQCQKNHQSINLHIDQHIVFRMDRSMFIQILHNVFSNFIKYAGSWSVLSCWYSKDHQGTTFFFADTGIGIPEEEFDHVKEKFYKINKARTRDEYLSMGIGFSIIERITKLHGGAFTLEPNTPTGLKISIHIPK